MAQMQVIAVSPWAFLLTDGESLYNVWRSSRDTPTVFDGMKVNRVDCAFLSVGYTEYCGAEVDMRQNEEDEMTEEVRLLGDAVAECLTNYFTEQEKQATALWEAKQSAKAG